MKKYLLSFSVLMMALLTFTACGDDDDEDFGGVSSPLAKTSWTCHVVDEEESVDITINFDNDKTGLQYATGTVYEDGMELPMEMYAQFSYVLQGKRGVLMISKMNVSVVTPAGIANQEFNGDYIEGAQLQFEYNADRKTLTILDQDGNTVMNQQKYKEIKYPTSKK